MALLFLGLNLYQLKNTANESKQVWKFRRLLIWMWAGIAVDAQRIIIWIFKYLFSYKMCVSFTYAHLRIDMHGRQFFSPTPHSHAMTAYIFHYLIPFKCTSVHWYVWMYDFVSVCVCKGPEKKRERDQWESRIGKSMRAIVQTKPIQNENRPNSCSKTESNGKIMGETQTN